MRVGTQVSWQSSGGTARGIIRSIHRSGTVPNIPVTINASEDDPAARIELLDSDGEPRGEFVGHKLSTLRVGKTQPTASQVHVDGAEWEDEEKGKKKKPKDYYKGDEVEKQTYQPPESARNNAQRALRWREEHGSEVRGGTSVGWARARQLASGRPVSRDTVARMSAFNRHRQNSTVKPEFKSTPWRDAGHVAWLLWGGTEGIDFARRVMRELRKRSCMSICGPSLNSFVPHVLRVGSEEEVAKVHAARVVALVQDVHTSGNGTVDHCVKSSADTLLFSVDSDTGIVLTATVFADVASPDVAPSGRIDLDALLDSVYKGVAVLTFAPAESVATSSDSVSLSDNLHTALRTFHGSEAVVLRSGVAGMAAKAHNSVTSSSSNEVTPALLARKVYGGILPNLFHSPMLPERNAMGNTKKRMMNDDSFTTSHEAITRSMDLGLNGVIHTHETADGQAVYMPGASHKAYLERMADLAGISDAMEDEAENTAESRQDLLERAISSILHSVMEHEVAKASDILKVDTARRIVWGWASVSTVNGEMVTDRQGDRIAPDEMEKMADRFMRSARAAKAMHDGDDVGEVIHSFPLTAELAKAFGIKADREGWITGTYIKSDAEWAKVLKGEYRGLSIGGRAKRRQV